MTRQLFLLFAILSCACGARSSLIADGEESTSSTSSTSSSSAGGAGGEGGFGGTILAAGGGGAGGSGEGGQGGDPTTTTTTDATVTVTTDATTTTGPICVRDIDCDDGVDCTIDTCGAAGCSYAVDLAVCDDGIFCTHDTCDGSLGCINAHSDVACDDGVECTLDECDAAADQCVNAPCDNLCDDGSFCNGVSRCDAVSGCTPGPASCLDTPCATSSCNEVNDRCSHSFVPGCIPPDVHILVTDDDGHLYDVTPYRSPSTTFLANSNGAVHLDVAVLGGRWFAVDSALVELAPGTNQVIATLGVVGVNSLGAGPDGMLYAANTTVYRIHPNTGAISVVGLLPEGHASSGDIAFLGQRMFISTDSPCGGGLVEMNVATGAAVVLGGDGLGCVYGLAAVSGDLYVLNCDGTVGTFDPDSGEMKIFATTPVTVYGADRLP